MSNQMLYRVEEGAKPLDLSRATVYQLLHDGVIASVKIGRARRIPRVALERFVAELQAAGGDGTQDAVDQVGAPDLPPAA